MHILVARGNLRLITPNWQMDPREDRLSTNYQERDMGFSFQEASDPSIFIFSLHLLLCHSLIVWIVLHFLSMLGEKE